MSLEEKFKALMKSYQSSSSSNQELINQNEYLRQQLREASKHSILLLNPIKEMRARLKVIILSSQVKKMFKEGQDMREDQLKIQMIFKLILERSKASYTLKNSLTGLL